MVMLYVCYRCGEIQLKNRLRQRTATRRKMYDQSFWVEGLIQRLVQLSKRVSFTARA